ncbi:hypothetical protein [Kosakonia sp. MUSA4]|uniref:hypothetical protein n=1 Tax=Kosakonia sp. MUSA4 TaxID=2067958 RepID=UPI00159901D7|nr:hypothetical protein [Kosakonia sp. MUSA4]QJT82449.1 hypothetical protein C0557_21405 [Kosakonia sp. MUSA4]
MVDYKKLQIRYTLRGEPVELVFQWAGFDVVNSILTHLVSLHVEPNLIPAQERTGNGGTRNIQKDINLIEHGIDDVSYFDEESQKWLEIPTKWLVNV